MQVHAVYKGLYYASDQLFSAPDFMTCQVMTCESAATADQRRANATRACLICRRFCTGPDTFEVLAVPCSLSVVISLDPNPFDPEQYCLNPSPQHGPGRLHHQHDGVPDISHPFTYQVCEAMLRFHGLLCPEHFSGIMTIRD